MNCFRYHGRPIDVIDGDTIDFKLDLGFKITRVVRLRLLNIDTAEIYGPESDEEYRQGQIHKDFVEKWLTDHMADVDWPFVVDTHKDTTGKYGRYTATVVAKDDGSELTEALKHEFPELA